MDANTKLVAMLASSQTFRDYEHAYGEAFGLPLALRPVESWQLPFHGQSRENAFCALMAGQSRTCAACLRLQGELTQAAMNEPATRTCIYGLCETAVPVKLGANTIGFLQTGQVLRQPPSGASFRRALQQAEKLGVDIGNELMKQAYLATPVVSPRKLAAVSRLLAACADHLAMKASQLVVQAANTESPVITRAKQFISEHSREKLALSQVARAVNMSHFYFCKKFRLATGLHFTEFVCRTRIEKAKNLLLNPNLRVSEIAFEIGFNSLTHFNRSFKRVLGQSPTEYRGRLSAGPFPALPPSGASMGKTPHGRPILVRAILRP